MMQIPQSTFLQALGCAIINSLWQFAFLWLIYFFINTIFKLSSKQKYSAAVLLQFTGFLWFAGTLTFYYKQWNNISDSTAYLSEYSFAQLTSSSNDLWLYWMIKAQSILPYLSIAYLLLLVFLTIKWLQAYFYTREIKHTGLSKINVDWRLFVQKISEQLGIHRKVSIYLSEMVKAPLTIGFLKPIILIPCASINHLSTEQMEAVILHELAHIKRFDYLLNLLLTLIEVVMFFNPFMQLLSRHIKRERESSCDDWVLQYEYNAASYARALLKIALLQSPAHPSLAMNATANNDVLLMRVKRMIEKSEKSFHYRHQLLALLFTTTILSFIAWFLPANNNLAATKTGKATTAKLTTKPVKIDNPLFNPVFFLTNPQNETIEVKQIASDRTETRLTRHLPVLAIPSKKQINLTEISTPVIIRSTPTIIQPAATYNRLVTLSGMRFNIDTAFQQLKVRNLYSTAMFNQIERTERDLSRTFSEIQKSVTREQAFDKEKVIQKMKRALEKIKATKQKLANKASSSAKEAMTFNKEDGQTYTAELDLFEQEKALQNLAAEIQKAVEQLHQQYLLTASMGDNASFTYSVPTVVYSMPASHSFSFEYSDKPGTRVIGIPSARSISTTRSEERKRISIPEKNEGNDAVEESDKIIDKSIPSQKEPLINKITKRIIIHI